MTADCQLENRTGCLRESKRALLACGICLAVVSGGFSQSVPEEMRAPAAVSGIVGSPSCDRFIRGDGRYARLRSGGIQTSEDKVVWTARPLVTRTFLRGLTYGRGLFVAVGGSYLDAPGVIITSRDGITWRERKVPGKNNLYGVAFGQGLFVAVGDAGAIYTSVDGVSWKSQRSGFSATLLATVAAGNGVFIAGGDSGTILTSTNGIHWMVATLGTPVYVGTIRFRDGTFIVEDRGATVTSTDGLAWHRRDMETTAALPPMFPQNTAGK